MIVRPMQNWFRMLFIWNGSVLLSIIPQLIVVAILSSIAAFTHGRVFGEKIPLSPAPFTLFGLTLAIFLAFRNNASYARYTEARLLWGGMLVSSRILVSQTLSYLPQQIRVADYLIAFAYVLKHQLRCTDPTPDLVRYLGAERAAELRRKLRYCHRYLARKVISVTSEIFCLIVRLHLTKKSADFHSPKRSSDV